MTDFVSDGQPFETPLSSAVEGYAATPPSFGQAVGALFGEGPIPMMQRAVERGGYQGSSDFDQDLRVIGAANAEMPIEPPRPSPMLSAADANKRFAPEGTKITDAPIPEGLARLVGKEKAEEVERESVLARYDAVHSWPVRFGTGMAAFMLDPVNASTMFLPGVGEDQVLGAAARLGIRGGYGARVLARLGAGGATGALAQAPLSVARYGLGQEEASDYDLRSAFNDMAFSAAGGAILHAGLGAGADMLHGRAAAPDIAQRTSSSPDGTLNLVRNLERSGDSAVSPAGAIGRYQIMPGTAREYGFDPSRLTDPTYNEQVARTVLADLGKRYGGDLDAMLVAYNAGPGRADQWLKAGRDVSILKPETRAYLAHAHQLTGVQQNLTPDAFTTFDAMRGSVSQITDGRDVDVSPVFSEHDAAAGVERTSLAAGAPPIAGTWENIIDDISQKRVKPQVGAIADHYDMPQSDAAVLLRDLSTRPDPPIELASGRYSEPQEMAWRLRNADRVEESLRQTDSYAWRTWGTSRADFPSTAAFVDHLYHLEELAEQPAGELAHDPSEVVAAQRDKWANGFAPGVAQPEFEAMQRQVYGASPQQRAAGAATTRVPVRASAVAAPAQGAGAQLAMLERALTERVENGATLHPDDAAELDRTAQGLASADLREQAYQQAAECLTGAGV